MSNGIYFSFLLFAMIFLTRYGLLLKHSFRYGGHAEAKLLLKIILRFFSHKNEMLKIVPENCRSLVDLFMCENFQCSKRLLADYCCMFFTSLSVLPSREFLPYFYVSISYIIFLKFKDSFAMFLNAIFYIIGQFSQQMALPSANF